MSNFVDRIRFLASGQDDVHSRELDACADRIELLEKVLKCISEYHPEITHTWADNVRKIAWLALRDETK